MESGTKPKMQTLKLGSPVRIRQKSFTLNLNEFKNQSRYQKPKEIGYYSVDLNRKICHDKSQLRYYINSESIKVDNVCFNLMDGYEKKIFIDFDVNELLDHILKWILEHKDSFADHPRSKLSTLNTDFVVKRGCLSRILCFHYSYDENWKLAVIRFNDTFYLCEFKTQPDQGENELKSSHKGWKFEQYLTSDKPNGKADTSIPINNCEAYYTVVKTQLNEHSLILSGEVDCVDSNGKPVELKSKAELNTRKKENNFKRYQLLKYWAQNFILGVPRIICGFHKADIVHSLKEYITDEIPIIIKDIDNPWKPEICVNFLDQFLTFIKETIPVNDHRKVYLFSRDKDSSKIMWDMLKPDTEYHFLPDWYIDEFEH